MESLGDVCGVANIHYNKGSMYEKRGLFDEAERDFKKVLLLIKDTTSQKERALKGGAYFHLGCIYQRRGEIEKAKHYFEECLKIIPEHKKAKENLEKIFMN